MPHIFSVSFLAVFVWLFTRTHSKELQSNDSTSACKSDPHSGMPGMPGVPGIPGTPGAPGRDGFKGEKGSIGKRGSQGTIGIPGKIGPRGPEGSKGEVGKKGEIGKMGAKGSTGIPGNTGPGGLKGSKGDRGSMGTTGSTGIPGSIGPRGYKGSKGERGSMGTKGRKGIPGNIGPRGFKGFKGENGIGAKGEKGDAENMDPRQRANWKQCAWKREDNTDNGKIQECSFHKLHDNTALRVSYQGNVQVYSDHKCNRWYFKFNGSECGGPLPIESVVLTHGLYNILEGYCENLARGTVSVELWVGKCSRYPLGNACTGWNSVSRIMIEEVPPSQ